ncbi:tripartite tricarboxylate transporter permease [Pararhodobacter sp.]|uniref:tripartite tricarboxylate transporter permease n=1 Tax=Pararhodobacter sp. TaxID=2127056 RepID=UPI002AFDED89|nr:tripartite tricarboxylate transporter permease [Pararhodobacter sp.]
MEFLSNLDTMALLGSAGSILVGLFVGMLFGALPGLGLTIAITLLLPLTYTMEPLNAILMLLAVYQAAEYGGSISAIALGIPGTVMAAPIVQDGRAMAQESSPGRALGFSLYGSTLGGLFGGAVLILFAQPLARFALRLGDAEFFLLGLMGLVAVTAFAARDAIKVAISICLGLIAGSIGLDMFAGTPRLTFDIPQLYEGLNLIALVVGLFAFSEIFFMMEGNMKHRFDFDASQMKITLTMREMLSGLKASTIGAVIGTGLGILPGVGSTVAGWLSYSAAKSLSKNPEKFGNGSGEGIAAPDSANNAVVGGALLPFLTLGIPGTAGIAIIAGAFIIHGIQPGPQMIRQNPELINGIFIGFVVTTIGMFIMGKLLSQGFARALVTPNFVLVPGILILSIVGVFTSRAQIFDLWLALGIGLFAYLMRRLDYSVAGFVLAFVLSPIIETSFRRALLIANDDFTVFVTRPISAVLVATMALMLAFTVVKTVRKRRAAGAVR